jgi:hypothetical protein
MTVSGPSGQKFNQQFSGDWTRKTVFQGTDFAVPTTTYTGSFAAFNLYTQRGTWSLTTLYLCNEGECTPKTGQVIGTFSVRNPNPSDITPPVIVSGVIDTPTITYHALRTRSAKMTFKVTDDLSGVLSVNAQAQSTKGGYLFFYGLQPPNVLRSGFIVASTDGSGTHQAPGTYAVTLLTATDIAGNTTTITDAGTISQLFGGQPQIILKR